MTWMICLQLKKLESSVIEPKTLHLLQKYMPLEEISRNMRINQKACTILTI